MIISLGIYDDGHNISASSSSKQFRLRHETSRTVKDGLIPCEISSFLGDARRARKIKSDDRVTLPTRVRDEATHGYIRKT